MTPKIGVSMSELQVNEFIRQKKEDERWTWEKITKELDQLGYKSRRNGKPLTVATVRFRYYRPSVVSEHPGVSSIAIGASTSEDSRTVQLIKAAMKMKTDPDSKLAFIQQLIEPANKG